MGSRKITTGAGGWGLLGAPRWQSWLRKRVVLQRENEGFIRRDDSGSGRVSDRVPGRSPESFWDLRRGRKVLKAEEFDISRGENRIRLTLNLSGRRAFRETTRERAAILEGTVQGWVFPHENIAKSYRFVVNSGITKGVLFGFR